MSDQRHVDSGKTLASYANEILVRCIQCSASGRVLATWEPYRWKGAFSCTSCQLSLRTEDGDWTGPVTLQGRRACGHCGHKWLTVCEHLDHHPSIRVSLPTGYIRDPHKDDARNAACSSCGQHSPVDVRYARDSANHPVDPHFGLPLWLIAPCKGELMWAYNREHVQELSAYVGARLRTRQNSGNRSMCSRLPQWMKLAKNRDAVLAALVKLEALIPA